MKRTKIIYWAFTGLFAALMLMSSIPDILSVPQAKEMIGTHLGYPLYIIPFLGVAKLLGIIAVVVPGFPRLKEWAYAGFIFDFTGAMYSGIAVGDPASSWLLIIIPIAVLAGSYIYYHKKLKAHTESRTETGAVSLG